MTSRRRSFAELVAGLALSCGSGGPSPADFVGTWSCTDDRGNTETLMVSAEQDGTLIEVSSQPGPAGAFVCTMIFTLSGSTATTTRPYETNCSQGGNAINGIPSSYSEMLRGSTLALTETPPGEPPIPWICLKQ